MKCVAAILLFVAAAFAADFYTSKYDNIDIDAILANNRLFKNYLDCLLEKGKCNEEGSTLKSVIPDALVTNCAKCNDRQKTSVRKVVRHLIKERPAEWQALLAKYDPKGVHRHNYQHYIDEFQH